MNKIKWISLLLSASYILSLFGYWKGVDASVDFQRGIDIIGLYPVFIIGLSLALFVFFKKDAVIVSYIGVAILIIGEVAYLLDWRHIFQGINLTYSMKHIHSSAIISLVCATALLFIAVLQQKYNNKILDSTTSK